MFKKIISVITALSLILSVGIVRISADDVADDTVYDENFIEDDSEETDERQAVAGAFNEETEVTIPATKVKLKSGSLKNILVGETFQIKISFKPSNSDDYVTYRSMNPKIVKVTKDGLVTAVGEGGTTVRLTTSTGKRTSVVVNVSPNENVTPDTEVSSVSVMEENIMLRSGKTAKIEYILYPVGVSDTITFTSDNPDIAKVSSDGTIKGLNDGNAIITLKTSSGLTAQCTVTVYTGVFKGIDVSKWQGTINWKKVKKSGIDFAMIRSSYGDCDVDEKLKANVRGCEKYDIPYGFYHYTYAKNVSEAKKEARFFLKTIKNFNPEYPVVLDIEENFYKSMSKKKVTDIICAFVEVLEDKGYYAMIYSYASFLEEHTDINRLAPYDIWIACWGDEEKLNSSYSHHYGMWQYTDEGKISGITENTVDLNYAYKDYAERIRRFGLNNLK